MPTLTARHPSQGIVRLNFDAPSVEAAVRLAESQGYRVVSSGGFALPTFRVTRPKRIPLTLFSHELLSLLEAGLPLLKGIEILARKARDRVQIYCSRSQANARILPSQPLIPCPQP